MWTVLWTTGRSDDTRHGAPRSTWTRLTALLQLPTVLMLEPSLQLEFHFGFVTLGLMNISIMTGGGIESVHEDGADLAPPGAVEPSDEPGRRASLSPSEIPGCTSRTEPPDGPPAVSRRSRSTGCACSGWSQATLAISRGPCRRPLHLKRMIRAVIALRRTLPTSRLGAVQLARSLTDPPRDLPRSHPGLSPHRILDQMRRVAAPPGCSQISPAATAGSPRRTRASCCGPSQPRGGPRRRSSGPTPGLARTAGARPPARRGPCP
jgi:hypothetical protein